MAGMLAISPPPTSLKAIRARARAGDRSCAKRFKARSKSISHFEGLSKPGKCLLKRLLKQKVAQGRLYGPDATPHDLGDNPIRSEFNTTLENGQRTKLTETFYFDHDGDGGQTTPDLAKTTTSDWVYDANDRLLSETIDHHDDALDRTESFVMDLFGNRANRTVDYVDPTAVDQAFAYSYDDNDRLTSETLDENADGSIDQTMQYSWDSTQQTAKEIFTGDSTAPADLVSSQTFAYDLQGRLAEVIATPETGPATKVTYEYDTSGIRVSSSQFTDANSNGIFETSELDHTIDYLVDHRNHTGYAQTIAETTTDDNGDNVSRTTYTFGTDELSQTTYTSDPATADAWLAEAMHIFGHDAHGSVRILLDALGEIAQTFTYAAYGELLAIYDSTGTLVGTLGAADTSAALTNLLYSGESFDSRIGQQYLRARWYNSAAGRFSRLDPYFGTLNDPLSFNKFNYVHSNPVLGIDPSGRNFTISGLFSSANINAGLRAQSNGAQFRALRTVNRVVDFIETITLFRDIFSAISNSPEVASHLRRMQRIANLNSNNPGRDWIKLRGLTSQHMGAVISELTLAAPTALPKMAVEHFRLLAKARRQARYKRVRDRVKLVISLPSLPGRFTGANIVVPSGLRVAGLPLAFAISKTGKGGSLFGIGLKLKGDRRVHQLLRVDYHSQKNPKHTLGPKGSAAPGVAGHGFAYLLGSQNGLGPVIAGLGGRPKFHYHIPYSTI